MEVNISWIKEEIDEVIREINIEELEKVANSKGIGKELGNIDGGLRKVLEEISNLGEEEIDELIYYCELNSTKNDTIQQGKKRKANSTGYGYVGTSASRFYFIPFVEGITTAGKTLLLNVVKFISKEFGVKVLYGDTDSMFIHIEPLIPQEIKDEVRRTKDFKRLREYVYKILKEEIYPKLEKFIDWYMWEFYEIPPEEHFYSFKTEIIIDKALFLKGREDNQKSNKDEDNKFTKLGIEIQLLSPVFSQYYNQFFDKNKYYKNEKKNYEQLYIRNILDEILIDDSKEILKKVENIKRNWEKNLNEIRAGLGDDIFNMLNINDFINQLDIERIQGDIKDKVENGKSLFGVKKKYILHIIDNEGVEKDEFIYQGVDLKRSEIPLPIKEYLKNWVENVIFKKYPNLDYKKDYLEYVENVLNEYIRVNAILWNIENIAINKAISKSIEKYETRVYTIEGGKLYNIISQIYNLPKIEAGNKVKVVYIKGIDIIKLKSLIDELRRLSNNLRSDKLFTKVGFIEFIRDTISSKYPLFYEIFLNLEKSPFGQEYKSGKIKYIVENNIPEELRKYLLVYRIIRDIEKEQSGQFYLNVLDLIENNISPSSLNSKIIMYDFINIFLGGILNSNNWEDITIDISNFIRNVEELIDKLSALYNYVVSNLTKSFYLSIPTGLMDIFIPNLVKNLFTIDFNKIYEVNVSSKVYSISSVVFPH